MQTLAIEGARLAAGAEVLDSATILIDGGQIAQIARSDELTVPPGARRIDARGLLAVPGYLDFHTHGALGVDYFGATPDEVARVLEWLPSTGVTGVLATTTTAPPDTLLSAVRMLAELVEQPGSGARLLGIHLEGPWIADSQRGAQLASAIRPPDVQEFQRLQEAARGHIRAVSLAPEQPGGLGLVRHLAATGVVAAAGHTEATYQQIMDAVAVGLTHVTHCFNRMTALHHREPGAVGAALTSPALTADVILDGHHVHPAAAQVLYRSKGADRLALITDAMQATGLGDGTYVRPGNRRVVVQGGVVRLTTGALAGSVLTLDVAVRNAARWFGLCLSEAALLASAGAARLLGLESRKGMLAVGADADVCLLDEAGEVFWTIVGGEVAYRRSGTGGEE